MTATLRNPRQRSRIYTVAAILMAVAAALFLALKLPSVVQGSVPTSAPTAIQLFEARLSGSNEVPAVSTMAQGQAILALADDMTTLHYRVMVQDIQNVTAAHIHLGAPGVNGGAIFTLYGGSGVFAPYAPISGTITLNASQRADLLAGQYYINVHTTAHPSGEIRGQVEGYTPPTHLSALLHQQTAEEPPRPFREFGVARFTLVNTNTLQYELAVSNIPDITAAHIHKGARGEDGPVVIPFYTGTGSFDPSNPISGTVMLTAENLVDLLTNYYYVNIHTTEAPAGLVRGQVNEGNPVLLDASLSGAGEVPPRETPAHGRTVMALSSDLRTLHYRVMVSDIISMTAAHFHKGPVGQNGGVVFPIYNGSTPFGPGTPLDGMISVTADQAAEFLGGEFYLNVHTLTYPGGEIRGQVHHNSVMHGTFNAILSGAEEVPMVTTPALGIVRLYSTYEELSYPKLALRYTVAVTDISNITAAHIHKAARGSNGGVVFGLYNGTGAFDPNNPITGTIPLGPEALIDLHTGYYYVNVHTTAHPTGEIRGQVGRARLFAARLSGANEVPAVDTPATGWALLALDESARLVHYNITTSNLVNVTAAHVHRAPAGQNGPILSHIVSSVPFTPTDSLGGYFDFPTDQGLFTMLKGGYYINFHTTQVPSGEIRGQIMPYELPTEEFVAWLNKEVSTDSAVAHFRLDPELNVLHYEVELQNFSMTPISVVLRQSTPMGDLYLRGNAEPFTTTIPLVGSRVLHAEQLLQLVAGASSLRITTDTNPEGEISGPVMLLRELFVPLAR